VKADNGVLLSLFLHRLDELFVVGKDEFLIDLRGDGAAAGEGVPHQVDHHIR